MECQPTGSGAVVPSSGNNPPAAFPETVEFILPASQTSVESISNEYSRSPTKQLCSRLTNGLHPPESPDMKFARNRFGTLLTSIKTKDSSVSSSPMEKTITPMNGYDRRAPGRPRKPPAVGSKTKSGEMIFELRGKPFALREERTCTEYQLCRAWMRGKISDEPKTPTPPQLDDDVSMDLLATRDVLALPRATAPYTVDTAWPEGDSLDKFNEDVDPEDAAALRREYARHWKSVKTTWTGHVRERSKRYHRTIGLLETIFNMTQQTNS